MNTPSRMFSPSLLADIVDFDALKTRSNRLGAYFAMRTMLIPAGGAIDGSFAFYMLGVIGFDPGGSNNAATQGLITIAVFLPMALLLISGLLMLLTRSPGHAASPYAAFWTAALWLCLAEMRVQSVGPAHCTLRKIHKIDAALLICRAFSRWGRPPLPFRPAVVQPEDHISPGPLR